MAKRNNEPTSSSDKAKVRVLFAEVEGNNESIQEALKTMLSAMSRPVRAVSEHRVDGNSAALLEQADVDTIEDVADQAKEGDVIGEEHAPSRSKASRDWKEEGPQCRPKSGARPEL